MTVDSWLQTMEFPTPMSEPDRINRRQFARNMTVASAAASAALASSSVFANQEKPAAGSKTDDQKDKAPAKESPPEELLLLTFLTEHYPSEHFDDAALRGIYNDIRGDLARGRILSEFPLKNSDAPSFQFRAFRGPK